MSNTTRKTQRKNKTNQKIVWPTDNEYFTLDSLIKNNQHMLTSSGSDITLRVKTMKCVKEEPKTIAVIGTINVGKGRPQLVFAMRPVKQSVVEKAKADKVMLVTETELVPVMEFSVQNTTTTTPTPQPVKVTPPTKTVTA